MKRFVRVSLLVGESLFFHAAVALPAMAQTATPTATPTVWAGTGSALPEAGTGMFSLFLVIFGVLVAVAGLALVLQPVVRKAQ